MTNKQISEYLQIDELLLPILVRSYLQKKLVSGGIKHVIDK